MLLDAPRIKPLKKVVPNMEDVTDDEWYRFLCSNHTYQTDIGLAIGLLCDLGEVDMNALDLLTQVAAADSSLKKEICYVLYGGGYLGQPRGFRGFVQIEESCKINRAAVDRCCGVNVSVSDRALLPRFSNDDIGSGSAANINLPSDTDTSAQRE